MNEIVHHKFGFTFPTHIIIAGYILMVMGLFIALTYLVAGLSFAFVGTFLSFTKNGILFNPTAKTYRSYTSYLGIKMGKWQSYESYPFLAILRRTISKSRTSRMGVSKEVARDTYFDIFLLNKTHRVKLLINRQKGQDEAKLLARDLAEKLNVEYVDYNPVLSAKTRGMRR